MEECNEAICGKFEVRRRLPFVNAVRLRLQFGQALTLCGRMVGIGAIQDQHGPVKLLHV